MSDRSEAEVAFLFDRARERAAAVGLALKAEAAHSRAWFVLAWADGEPSAEFGTLAEVGLFLQGVEAARRRSDGE